MPSRTCWYTLIVNAGEACPRTAEAIAGTSADVTLTGDLTIHGVTKSVSIPAQAQLANGTVQVAGSITFPLSDYDMVAPNIGGFIVSIADQGTLEFVAVFARA